MKAALSYVLELIGNYPVGFLVFACFVFLFGKIHSTSNDDSDANNSSFDKKNFEYDDNDPYITGTSAYYNKAVHWREDQLED